MASIQAYDKAASDMHRSAERSGVHLDAREMIRHATVD